MTNVKLETAFFVNNIPSPDKKHYLCFRQHLDQDFYTCISLNKVPFLSIKSNSQEHYISIPKIVPKPLHPFICSAYLREKVVIV